MSTEKEVSNWWNILLLFGGVFAVINLIRAFSKSPKEAHEQYEEIIAQKDKIIDEQQKTIERLLKYGRSERELE